MDLELFHAQTWCAVNTGDESFGQIGVDEKGDYFVSPKDKVSAKV